MMKNTGLDSKYSWLVAVASSFIFLLSSWPMRIGGQIFVSLLDNLNINRKAASFPFSVAYLMRSVSGPFAGYFGEKIGLQAVTLIGCFFCAMGMFGCYFAEDIIVLDIFMGLIYGIGFGWATAVIPEILNRHFDKHLAKANGITIAGGGLGAFVTPPIIVILTKTFGISGTFLIMSAIILNGIPLSMILTEPYRQKKLSRKVASTKTKSSVTIKNSKNALNLIDTPMTVYTVDVNEKTKEPICDKHNKNHDLQNYISPIDNYEPNVQGEFSYDGKGKVEIPVACDSFHEKNMNSLETKKAMNQHCSNCSTFNQDSSDKGLDFVNKSNQFERQNLPILLNVSKLSDEGPSECNTKISINSDHRGSNALNKTSTKRSHSSLKILLTPLFLLMTTIQSSHFYIMYISWTIAVNIARDKGAKEDQEAYFIMGLALFDMLGRAFFGALTDSGCVSRVNLNVISFACMGICCLIVTLVSGFVPTLFIFCLFGLTCGSNTTGLPGLVTQFFHKEERSMAMASRLLMYAPMSFTMSPLIGYFRESLGSYNGLLYILATICAICSLLLIILQRIYSNR